MLIVFEFWKKSPDFAPPDHVVLHADDEFGEYPPELQLDLAALDLKPVVGGRVVNRVMYFHPVITGGSGRESAGVARSTSNRLLGRCVGTSRSQAGSAGSACHVTSRAVRPW